MGSNIDCQLYDYLIRLGYDSEVASVVAEIGASAHSDIIARRAMDSYLDRMNVLYPPVVPTIAESVSHAY